MDTVLVVSYSFTGHARRLAQDLCAQRGWPLGEITDAQSRTGGAGTWRCVLDSLLRRRPAIHYRGPDPADFRLVVLVSPIWAYRLAGPMRSFVHERAVVLRRVAVVSSMGSGGASNAVAEIAHLLGHKPLAAIAIADPELQDGSYAGKLQAFAESLQPRSTATQPVRVPAWSTPIGDYVPRHEP